MERIRLSKIFCLLNPKSIFSVFEPCILSSRFIRLQGFLLSFDCCYVSHLLRTESKGLLKNGFDGGFDDELDNLPTQKCCLHLLFWQYISEMSDHQETDWNLFGQIDFIKSSVSDQLLCNVSLREIHTQVIGFRVFYIVFLIN